MVVISIRSIFTTDAVAPVSYYSNAGYTLSQSPLVSATHPRNKVLLCCTWHLLHRYQLPMSSPTLPPLLPLVLHTPQHDSHLGGEEE